MAWTGKTPTRETPSGATYAYNRVSVLKNATVMGIGIGEDRLNPGEYIISLMMVRPDGKVFSVQAWRNEELASPGWLDIMPIDNV
jgi:hypothetical protein